ncbi:hypothetical protein [Nocardia sp. NPDC050406]|uniref:hypothetical protein n=1 Tax=Nocardia sp. NPDC050406 TaxID=3364318 RepID=UPI0037B3C5DF
MKFKKVAATSALVIAALGIASGTSYADVAPAPSPVVPSVIDGVNQGINQVLPAIHWNAKIEGDSIVVDTDGGSLTTDNGQLQVVDNQGTVLTAVPLNYTLNDLVYPIDASVDGLRAVLTPVKDPAAARPVADSMRHDVVRQDAMDDALSAAATQFGLATSIGTLVGTLVGAVVGCLFGGVLGLAVGCLPGAAAGIALGAAAGLVLTGVPAAIIVGIILVNRLNDPQNQ